MRQVIRSAAMAATVLAGGLGLCLGASAQTLQSIKTPSTPLVLKARGSFYVGGEQVQQTKVELGNLGPDDTVTCGPDVRGVHGSAEGQAGQSSWSTVPR